MLDISSSESWRALQHYWYWLPLGLVGLISWTVWAFRWALSRRYRPIENDHRTTTSVVVPVYREDPDLLARCLESWLHEGPNEIILVVDVDDVGVLQRLAHYQDERLQVIPFRHQGKRSALGVGIRTASQEVIVLVDSDTAWEPGMLAHLQMPFADPSVGGVSTRQNAFARESSVWRVVADWLVNIRYLDYVPAQGMAGGVACLSGRTAAYRRAAILPVLAELEHEYFFGRKCDSGDDGRLTWLVLKSGWRTVYQGSARAWSMFPCSFGAFVKQRLRWSRNSYRCYSTAIWKGWLWQQPIVTQITVLQILLTPVTMFCALGGAVMALIHQHWGALALALGWLFLGRAIRSVSHLREHPRDLRYLPIVTGVVAFIALPIKTWAAVTMNTHGWLTRSSERFSAEAQSEASLNGQSSSALVPLAATRSAMASAEEPVISHAPGYESVRGVDV